MYKWSVLQSMVAMNKVMDPQKTAETMRAFERENAKMEMTEEMSMLYLFGICNMHAVFCNPLDLQKDILASNFHD
jgi:hypothetical protein